MLGLSLSLTRAGVPVWQPIVNQSVLSTQPYIDLMQSGRDGVNTPLLIIGDSIGFGYGSASSNGPMRMSGLGPQIAASLAANGIKAQAQGFFGNGRIHGATTESKLYDARVTLSTTTASGITSLGGVSFPLVSAASPEVTFSPDGAVDTFEIYVYKFANAGHITYAVDGGAAVDINCNTATNGLVIIPVTGLSLATHSITLAYASGNGGYLLGFNAYIGAQQGLQFVNAANNGGIASDYTPNSNAFDAMKVGKSFAPRATMIVLGANHWNQALSVSSFATDLQALVTGYEPSGPVILVSDPASNPSTNAAIAVQRNYVAAMRQVAVTNGLLMLDLWTHFGGRLSDFSLRTSDGIHPNPVAYTDAASFMADALLTIPA